MAATLRHRLNEHVNKINKRQNITLDDMRVRFVTFESEWWVFAAEYVLIAYFDPDWNFSGLGGKSTRERASGDASCQHVE